MSSTPRHALAAALGLIAIALTPAAAQQYQAGPIRIEAPWIRATPAGAQVAGGYMKLTNTGKAPDRLIGGSTAVAGKFQIHEMKMKGSIMKMRELPDGLELKPGESVELRPGSYHLMLADLKEPMKAGDKVKITLEFAKAGKIDVEYPVRSASGHDGGHGKSMH
ncbi:MAG TPA: copper chaperone PCu(A)C [Hyphomicrobiaceae bacterium]|nr:copper chaperone PCu(A)C [Hyphomicrobiaceae bacterium]